MKSFAMMVLGCKVNDYEATYLRNQMLTKYKEVSFKEIADIYIIFTCCVTNTAESKTRKMLHHARNMNKDAYVVAIGCLSQIKGNDKEFDDVDLIVGSSKKDEVFDKINEHFIGNITEKLENPVFEKLFIDNYPKKSRSFLKIQDGCNQYCSYCIIPYARGNERSCDHLELIKQAQILSKINHELVLTGIHTGRYNDNGYKLIDLLKDLIKIEDLKTIRLSSIELNEVNDEIIDLMKNNHKIAHHLHIPIQSGSDTILKLMNRPYNIDQFIKRINYIREMIPDISISTDLIVGFPEESEELFNETINNLRKIKFSFIHVFPFASKKGTKAAKLSNQIDNNIKKQRVNTIINIQKEYTLEFKKSFIGKKADLLIEKSDDKYVYGYIKQYFYMKALGNKKVGELVKIIIDEVNDEEVIGHVIV